MFYHNFLKSDEFSPNATPEEEVGQYLNLKILIDHILELLWAQTTPDFFKMLETLSSVYFENQVNQKFHIDWVQILNEKLETLQARDLSPRIIQSVLTLLVRSLSQESQVLETFDSFKVLVKEYFKRWCEFANPESNETEMGQDLVQIKLMLLSLDTVLPKDPYIRAILNFLKNVELSPKFSLPEHSLVDYGNKYQELKRKFFFVKSNIIVGKFSFFVNEQKKFILCYNLKYIFSKNSPLKKHPLSFVFPNYKILDLTTTKNQ
jgi:hypothetical protein